MGVSGNEAQRDSERKVADSKKVNKKNGSQDWEKDEAVCHYMNKDVDVILYEQL